MAGAVAVTDGVTFAGTRSAQGVVTAAGVGGDFNEDVEFVGINPRARRQVDAAVFADRVLGAVAFPEVGSVVKQGVGGLVAFEIEDAEGLSGLEFVHPEIAGGDRAAVNRVCRVFG